MYVKPAGVSYLFRNEESWQPSRSTRPTPQRPLRTADPRAVHTPSPIVLGVDAGGASCIGCSSLALSERGEFEITDVNTRVHAHRQMTFNILPGSWAGAGTHASNFKTSILVALAPGVTFDLHGGPSHMAPRTDCSRPLGSPSTRVGTPLVCRVPDRFLPGPNVRALRATLALALLAGGKTLAAMRSIRTHDRGWRQRDPDCYEGH